MPRCCSIFIQSERARRACPRALTSPARWIAPPCSSSFSVSVVLPASGCEMIAKVRRLDMGLSVRGSAAQLRSHLRSGIDHAVRDRLQVLVGIAFLARLERDFDRQRFLALGDADAAELVEHPRANDIALVGALHRAQQIA